MVLMISPWVAIVKHIQRRRQHHSALLPEIFAVALQAELPLPESSRTVRQHCAAFGSVNALFVASICAVSSREQVVVEVEDNRDEAGHRRLQH